MTDAPVVIQRDEGASPPALKWHSPERLDRSQWRTHAIRCRDLSPGDGGSRVFGPDGMVRPEFDPGNRNGASQVIREFSGPKVLSLGISLAERENSERPFEENAWVRAGIKVFSGGFVRLRSRLSTGEPGDDDSVVIDSHPLIDLLKQPNARMTERELWRAHVTNFKLDGESFWFLTDINGMPIQSTAGRMSVMPRQIVPVRGALVEDLTDERGMPTAYRYKTGKGFSPAYPIQSVVHFSDYDPANPGRGLGDVASVTREIELYFNAFQYMDAAVRNNGDPGGFLIYDQIIQSDEIARRQEAADDEFSTENARRIKVLGGGAKFHPNPVKPSDMQYQALAAWCRDAILAALGVPPPLVGVYTDATYNNVQTAHLEVWTGPNGILSLGELTADVVTNKLIPRLPREMAPSSDGAIFYFDHSRISVLKPDIAGAIEKAATIVSMGIGVSLNETLERIGSGVEDFEHGDIPWKGSLTDLEAPEEEPEDDEEPEAEADEDDDRAQSASKLYANGDFGEGVQMSKKLYGNVRKFLARWQREQMAFWRKIANGGGRGAGFSQEQRDILDIIVDPKGLTQEQFDALLMSETSWGSTLDKAVRVSLRNAWADGLSAAFAEAGQGALLKVTDPSVLAEIGAQRHRLVEGISSRLSRQIKNALVDSLSSAEKAARLRDIIKEILPELDSNLKRVFGNKDARAATIAQTETGIAESNARIKQFIASGVTHIRWETSRDDAVRESHVQVSNQVVPLGATFSNGLRWPHDPRGAAADVINCRCIPRAEAFKDD